MTQQPIWKLDTSGDDFALYLDATGVYPPELEIWVADGDADNAPGNVYRIPLDRCRVVTELDDEPIAPRLTTGPTDGPYAHDHAEWFSDSAIAIAASAGRTADDWRAGMCSDDPRERMHAYRDAIGYFGAFEFDQYPLAMDQEDWDRRDRSGRHPRTAEIAAYLGALDRAPPFAWIKGTDADGDPIPNPDMFEDGEPRRMDIRLQVHADGTWSIHTGDSQYDQDHRGTWSSTSIPFVGDPDDSDFDPRAVANELINDLEFDDGDGAGECAA